MPIFKQDIKKLEKAILRVGERAHYARVNPCSYYPDFWKRLRISHILEDKLLSLRKAASNTEEKIAVLKVEKALILANYQSLHITWSSDYLWAAPVSLVLILGIGIDFLIREARIAFIDHEIKTLENPVENLQTDSASTQVSFTGALKGIFSSDRKQNLYPSGEELQNPVEEQNLLRK